MARFLARMRLGSTRPDCDAQGRSIGRTRIVFSEFYRVDLSMRVIECKVIYGIGSGNQRNVT